jgi:hypothetical protein
MKPELRNALIVVAAVAVAFGIGAAWQFNQARQARQALDTARQEMVVIRGERALEQLSSLEATLALATVAAQFGDFERGRQLASDFFDLLQEHAGTAPWRRSPSRARWQAMRWRDFWVVVQSNSSGALPIVTLIAFLVGMIISFLGAVVLRRFGAGYYVSYLVGYGMLREMAALMTGIIMAGRTGAAFAAELGSMKITEEIDAFRTLGISPVDHLVLPRVLGSS